MNTKNASTPGNPPNLCAFTLVELLAVLAILALLFGLLSASVFRGRLAAHRVACANNLKQWGYATHLYADENNDQLPRESAMDGINTWEMAGASTNRDVWYTAARAIFCSLPDTSRRSRERTLWKWTQTASIAVEPFIRPQR